MPDRAPGSQQQECKVSDQHLAHIHAVSPFDLNSMFRLLLDRCAGTLPMLILYSLADGAKRFSELERTIKSGSRRSLIQRLRILERDGLIRRDVFGVVPPRVEYSLTAFGASLLVPLASLCEWADEHKNEMKTNLTAVED